MPSGAFDLAGPSRRYDRGNTLESDGSHSRVRSVCATWLVVESDCPYRRRVTEHDTGVLNVKFSLLNLSRVTSHMRG